MPVRHEPVTDELLSSMMNLVDSDSEEDMGSPDAKHPGVEVKLQLDPRSKSERGLDRLCQAPSPPTAQSRSHGNTVLSYFATLVAEAASDDDKPELLERKMKEPVITTIPAPAVTTIASTMPSPPQPERKRSTDIPPRPCTHNDWDDVRTRNGTKVLRCRVCQKQFKLASNRVPRCIQFLQEGMCDKPVCAQLHVHKKKKPLPERHSEFGAEVLKGVPIQTWKKAVEKNVGDKGYDELPMDATPAQRLAALSAEFKLVSAHREEIASHIMAVEAQVPNSVRTMCTTCNLPVQSSPFCPQTGVAHIE